MLNGLAAFLFKDLSWRCKLTDESSTGLVLFQAVNWVEGEDKCRVCGSANRVQVFVSSTKLARLWNPHTKVPWFVPCHTNSYVQRLRWSRGSVLAFGTQVRGFKPGRSRRIFQGEKILNTPSFGGEVKPSVPCRRFRACKRFLNATWKSGIWGKIHRAHIVRPLATRISGETTSGESWNV